MNPNNVFRKLLSLNDTGETGGHMGGILIPKSELSFFPTLDPELKNPREILPMKDQSGRTWKLNFIYYNSALFDGTRNEYRLTGLTEFIKSNELVGGDTLKITKISNEGLLLEFEKSKNSKSTLENTPTQLGLEFDTAEKAHHEHAMRPAARLIHTIGENLIKDSEAAIIELVKNSYDADARNVHIRFRLVKDSHKKRILRIQVEDDGHGMTYKHVVDSWLVPATQNKLSQKTSPKGRTFQGNKGIGRFAAFRLGSELFLQTVSDTVPIETSLLLQASDFNDVDFLDEVSIIVDTRDAPAAKSGSLFEMTSYEDEQFFHEWKKEDFDKLRTDFRRMLFPFRTQNDEFHIWLTYEGFLDFGQPDGVEEVEPLPLLDFYDYRIKVEVSSTGEASGYFSSQLVPSQPEEKIFLPLPDLKGHSCGTLHIDIQAVDREPSSLQSLLDRSREGDESFASLGKAQLKRLLNEACGVSIYRGDFRIRPYGDNGSDWLELDRKRVNNPSLCIGNNQVFGTIAIEEESKSHLKEKSARDGLREDEYYDRLRDVTSRIVNELQRRRYEIRRSIGRIKKESPVDKLLSRLTDFEKPLHKISELLKSEGISPERTSQIREILKLDSQDRQEAVAQLESRIATYQGQATLGKMVGKLLHEGNRSLGILRNQSNRIPDWLQRLHSTPTDDTVDEVTNGLTGISSASESLVDLFSSVEPLGVRSRKAAREVKLTHVLQTILNVFRETLENEKIDIHVEVPADFKVIAWEQDLNCVLLNLVENSIHWLTVSSTEKPHISFYLEQVDDTVMLHIKDNGPGIPLEHISSEAIFEPTFSLKGGVGLGLPIAGECATRNKFELRAVYSEAGAHFVLDLSPTSGTR